MTAHARRPGQPTHADSQARTGSQDQFVPREPVRIGVIDPDGSVGAAVLTMRDQVDPFVTADLEHARRSLLAHPADAVVMSDESSEACALLDSLTRLPEAPELLLLLSSEDTPLANWARTHGIGETHRKPVRLDQLRTWFARLADQPATHASGVVKRSEFGAGRILGRDPSMMGVREQVMRIAGFAGMPVLITGETGTGKELVARAIHELTARDEPFVSINCSAIPEHLFESELFGHAAGAFTGAQGAREGLLAEARRGTIFLDEVGELPESMQAKLLSVLEARKFRPVGATRELPLEARVVSASNAPLTESGGRFRQDLFYRLAGFTIRTPALRDRPADVLVLARHFVRNFCEGYGRPILSLSEDAAALLKSHRWPGNVRELQGVVETAAVNTSGRSITGETLEPILNPPAPYSIAASYSVASSHSVASSNSVTSSHGASPQEQTATGAAEEAEGRSFHAALPLVGAGRPFPSLAELERHAIMAAFDEAHGNLSRAARILGIPRSTLRDRLRRFGVASKG